MQQSYLETVLDRVEFPEFLSPDIAHLQGKKVLITGASGGVGRALADKLQKLSVEHVPTNQHGNNGCLRMDVCDKTEVKRVIEEYKPQIIVHLAAKTKVPWCEANSLIVAPTNALSVWNILESITPDIRLIFASSSMAGPDFNVYGRSKFIGERLMRHVENCCAIRFFNIIPTVGFLIDKWVQTPEDKKIVVPKGVRRTFISKSEAIGMLLCMMNESMGRGVFGINGPQAQLLSDIARRLYPDERIQLEEPLIGGGDFIYPKYTGEAFCNGRLVKIENE